MKPQDNKPQSSSLSRVRERVYCGGFSLVEMSIVLLMIILIVSGVLAAEDMIRASTARSLAAQLQRYDQGRFTFRTQYDCLPGDCRTASKYGLGANGDGNGIITDATAVKLNIFTGEIAAFWQHLDNAELLKEKLFNGVPEAPYKGSHIGVMHIDKQHYYAFGLDAIGLIVGPNLVIGKCIAAREMYRVDNKIDDGYPRQGKVVAFRAAFFNSILPITYLPEDGTCYDITAAPGTKPEYILSKGVTTSCCATIEFKQ